MAEFSNITFVKFFWGEGSAVFRRSRTESFLAFWIKSANSLKEKVLAKLEIIPPFQRIFESHAFLKKKLKCILFKSADRRESFSFQRDTGRNVKLELDLIWINFFCGFLKMCGVCGMVVGVVLRAAYTFSSIHSRSEWWLFYQLTQHKEHVTAS